MASPAGVHFTDPQTARDDAYMQTIDAVVDNGDLATGFFRRVGARRYYFVLEN